MPCLQGEKGGIAELAFSACFCLCLQSKSTGTEYCLLLLLETMMSFSSVSVSLTFPKIKSLTSITEVFASTAKANKKSFACRYVKTDFPPGTPEYTDFKPNKKKGIRNSYSIKVQLSLCAFVLLLYLCTMLGAIHATQFLFSFCHNRKQRNGSESEYTEKLQQYSKSLCWLTLN